MGVFLFFIIFHLLSSIFLFIPFHYVLRVKKENQNHATGCYREVSFLLLRIFQMVIWYARENVWVVVIRAHGGFQSADFFPLLTLKSESSADGRRHVAFSCAHTRILHTHALVLHMRKPKQLLGQMAPCTKR